MRRSKRQRNFSLFVLLHKRAKPLPPLRSVGPSRTADLMCVFYYCRTYYKAVRVGGCVCVLLLQDLITKLFVC